MLAYWWKTKIKLFVECRALLSVRLFLTFSPYSQVAKEWARFELSISLSVAQYPNDYAAAFDQGPMLKKVLRP